LLCSLLSGELFYIRRNRIIQTRPNLNCCEQAITLKFMLIGLCRHQRSQIVALSPLKDSYRYGREGAQVQKSVYAIRFRFSLTFHTKRISPDCNR
jgi:hypothetical protein